MKNRFDVVIIGSGFTGSLLAWILATRGRRVAIVDASTHPRFAVGESSTPIADLILRRLGEVYSLTDLVGLSTYGSWQQCHPELTCGRKRGFAYYQHQPNQAFTDNAEHSRSLMAAASASDAEADTHWLRSDVDQHFFQRAHDAGCQTWQASRVTEIHPGTHCNVGQSDGPRLTADLVIDASGRASVMARLLNSKSMVSELRTRTFSTFAHFRNVGSWREKLVDLGQNLASDPFDCDDSAQHHLLGNGWLWMLRFNNNLTSVGWTRLDPKKPIPLSALGGREDYPSIEEMFASASLCEPPGIVHSGRLQRFYDPCPATNCWMLPTSACNIDPLHSTGIAHGLSGVQRLAHAILSDAPQALSVYRNAVQREGRFLDQMVSLCYRFLDDFDRFTVACSLYFCAAIACEEQIMAGDFPSHYWGVADVKLQSAIDDCVQWLNESSIDESLSRIRSRMEPWNVAGLFDPNLKNRYAYTATK